MTSFFHPNRVLGTLQENLNPEFFLLNLRPDQASRAHTGDYTSTIVSWTQLILVVLLIIFLWRLFR